MRTLDVLQRNPVCCFVRTALLVAAMAIPGAAEEAKPQGGEKSDESANTVQQLVEAAAAGRLEDIQKLQAAGADLNAKWYGQLSACWAAKIRGYDSVVEYLKAQGADEQKEFSPREYLDAYLADTRLEDQPGVAVLVARDGKIVYQNSAGLASIEHHVPVTENTKFRIGSVTKQFTAAAILKLQEDGKLSVQDPLSKYIPDFPRGDEVTIHHLLTHTSGIHSYTETPEFITSVTVGAQPEAMIDAIKADPYDFDPGERFQYSNSGYFLLGYIIAKVSEQSYEQYLRATLFEPLEMHDTGVHTATAILPHEATGYSVVDGEVTKALDWDMSKAGGAGSLYSTIVDLHRWNEGLFGGKVLKPESLEQAFRPVEVRDAAGPSLKYGYGWMIDEYRGLKCVSHGGGLHGFVSHLARYPDQHLTVVVLHNASPSVAHWTPAELSGKLAEMFLWEAMEPRRVHEVAENVDPETYADYVGRYEYGPAVMEVTREEDRLFARLSGQPKYEIFPEGDDKFFWKAVDAQIQFQREDGKVTSAKHFQNGISFVAPRMEDVPVVDVEEETLERYAGKYDYPGIGVMSIRRDGKQLKAQMSGQPEFEIFAKSKDTFFWKVVKAEIQFVTDDQGKVTKAVHKQGGASLEVKKIE